MAGFIKWIFSRTAPIWVVIAACSFTGVVLAAWFCLIIDLMISGNSIAAFSIAICPPGIGLGFAVHTYKDRPND